MAAAKKTIYLEPEVDAALRAKAQAEGRSVTKQIDVMLRDGLGFGLRAVDGHLGVVGGPLRDLDRPARPDPKAGGARRRSSG